MYRKLPDELLEKARTEINEDPSRIEADLDEIKSWLMKQPHLNARQDNQWLLSFLRGCKYSLERTKKKLDLYYTMKTLIPEFFDNRNVLSKDIQECVKKGIFLPLYRHNSITMPRFVIMRVGSYDASRISFTQVLKANMILIEIGLMEDDYAPVNGISVILDMKRMSMAHLPPPTMIKKAMVCLQDAYPHRIKAVHFINTPSFFDSFYVMLRPLLSEKIRNRVQVHGTNMDSLYISTSKKILPTEYGGDGDSFADIIDSCLKKLDKYNQWFLEDYQYKSDESKRTSKQEKTADEMFGIEGSFRKLNVD